MSDDIIRIDFNYTEKEFIGGNRLFLLGSPKLLARIIVSLTLLALVFLMLTLLWADFPVWAAASVVALMEASLLYNFLVIAPRRYFRGDLRMQERHEMFFTEEGITVKTKRAEARMAWSLYTRVIEGEQFFCLVYGEGILRGTIIPKRAFRDRRDENAFRELLSRHLPKGLKARRADAGRLQESEYVPTDAGPPDWR